MSGYPISDKLCARARELKVNSVYVKEKEFKNSHEVFPFPPDDWAAARGATHTLYCGEGHGRGTRPAKLLKTRLYVGVDEIVDENGNSDILWEKWEVKQH